jgi:subtilase family serine protease
MNRTALAGLGALSLAVSLGTALPAAAHPSGSRAPVGPAVAQAPDSAFHKAAGSDDAGVACRRPAPDNRVSAYIHCYRPDDLRTFYGLDPLTPTTNDGAGQTIVLVDSYGTPTGANDLAVFARTFNGPTPNYDAVYPLGHPDYKNPPGNGGCTSGPCAAEGWAGEASLDIEWAYAMAPKAHIVLLATPPAETQGVQGLPNLMKAIDWAVKKYPSGTMFSMSFGTDEQAFGGNSARTQFSKFDQTFKRGLAKGDTFFSSSGDTGSVGTTRAHHQTSTGSTPEVSYPNVSPYVTSVGGTQVQSGWTWDPTRDKPFTDSGDYNQLYWNWTSGGNTQAPWNESWAGIATGGGLSTVYPRPAYQDTVKSVVGNHRGVPDVAWNAAVNGGVLTYRSFFPSIDGPPSWGVYGGTSASSPQVAAVTAIANQARAAAGKGPIGNLNEAIYSPSFDKSSAFSDVIEQKYGTTPSGDIKNNRIWDIGPDGFVTPDPVPGYPTTPGYDLTTGFGSPNEPGYVAQLVAAK